MLQKFTVHRRTLAAPPAGANIPAMRLSVLDQSMIVSGRTPAESIRETVALARLCDALGYHRYWVSEHHNSEAIAGSAPEVLLGALAMVTGRIRLGSAGVMLPHYSSLKVAEQFRVLEALAPGRIDLGLGRAPGSDGKTAFALNPNAAHAADMFPAQLRDVMAWVNGAPLLPDHPFRDIAAQPKGPGGPEIWVLGSSMYGAQVAAHFGLPYCFAYFFSEGVGAREALDIYRATYRPSAHHPEPVSAICVVALAADTQAEADRLFTAREAWRALRERGQFVPLPSPEEAAAFQMTEPERQRAAALRARALAGTPDLVATRLRDLARDLGVDEVALVTASHDAAARRRSYALIAREFGLDRDIAASRVLEMS
jgi:luciferase family oxidoreductase group 1